MNKKTNDIIKNSIKADNECKEADEEANNPSSYYSAPREL